MEQIKEKALKIVINLIASESVNQEEALTLIKEITGTEDKKEPCVTLRTYPPSTITTEPAPYVYQTM